MKGTEMRTLSQILGFDLRLVRIQAQIEEAAQLRRREQKLLAMLIGASLALAALLSFALYSEHERRAAGLTQYDRVQMDRLVNSVDY